MPTSAQLTSYEAARTAAAHGSKSFYFASRFFPPDLARAAHAVYWFCRTTDDIVDEATSVQQGREELEAWAVALDRALPGKATTNPVLSVFTEIVRQYGIPHDYPRELIEGMRMDLQCVRYANFDDLRVFCYRVASVVGLMMSYVIGYREPALDYAVDLGIAMQLTNILRDIGEDLGRGRIYLPQDEMRRFGYSEAELRRCIRNAAFRDLMQFQIERARCYYNQSLPGIELLHPDGRFAVRIAADVYRAILDQIEAADFDVFSRRAVVPPAKKYWLTARSLAVPAVRRVFRGA